MKTKYLNVGTGALLACISALPLAAQDTTISALEARIAELENQPKLGFDTDGVDLTFYGYVKADLIYDFDTDLGTTAFGLGSLSPGAETGSNFRGQAIQSRFGLRANIDSASAVLEGDFFGNGGGGFRLRHAYVDVGNFRFGQNWSNFMPIESFPSTLDFQGPAGIPFARVTQARYTQPLANGLSFSASLEQAAGTSTDPALTGAFSYDGDRYFVKLAAVGTRVTSDTGGEVDGFGVNLSGNAQLWSGGSLYGSLMTGEAIGSYMQYGGPDTLNGQVVESDGLSIGISQTINNMSLGVAYGLRENNIGVATDTEQLETVHLTASYHVRENTTFGVEYITGERDLIDGTSASADRIQSSVQFSF